MPVNKKSEPRCIEVRVNFGGGGKVAIKEYGKISSDYHASITRAYTIPPDWTDDDVTEFELAMIAKLHQELDPVFNAEFNERYDQRDW